MKIAVTSMGKSKEASSDMRFGRCEYFAVFNDETMEYDFISNDGVTCEHGAGVKASSQLAQMGIDAVITGRVGPNAMEILSGAEITIYRHMNVSIEEEIKVFKEEGLELIKESGAGHFRRGQR